MHFKRAFAAKLGSSLRARRSVLLFGPRQTGKTTLIKEVIAGFPRRLEYPLQLPSVRARLEGDPEAVGREAAALGGGGPVLVFIDEIQKAPALMDVLQYLLDERKIVLAATGSSAWKLRRRKTNWLPGRVQVEHLYPLTWEESGLLGEDVRGQQALEDRLLYGALPKILAEERAHRAEDLGSYASLYLEEEIRQEAAVRRLPPFARFLRLAALESGTSPNASKLAGEVGVSHTAIRDYYQLLEDSLIVHRLGAFGKSRADVLRKAKYYFFDLGVRNAAAGIGHDRALLTLQMGTLFEHHVVLEAAARLGAARLSYWRTKSGQEVDLVAETGAKVVALEIKATAKPRESDFAGLAAFRHLEKCDAAYLVCQVERAQKFPQGLALPWRELAPLLG